MNLMMILRQ